MEVFIWILGFAVLVFVVSAIYYMNKKPEATKGKAEQKNDSEPQMKEEEQEPLPKKAVYPYRLTKSIFSPKEWYFYRDVLPIAKKLGLTVFTKMRLADLLYIPEGTKDYMKWFNRIKAKHIDFIFVDSEMTIKLLVEIDDPTHNRADRKERDEEVDEIFRQQGIKVLHLRAWGKQYGAEDLETIITNALNVQKSAPVSELN